MFRAVDARVSREILRARARAEIYYLRGHITYDCLLTVTQMFISTWIPRDCYKSKWNIVAAMSVFTPCKEVVVVVDALVRRSYLRAKRGEEREAFPNLWNIRFGHRLIGGTVTQCSFEAAVSMRWFKGDRSRDGIKSDVYLRISESNSATWRVKILFYSFCTNWSRFYLWKIPD